MRSITVPEEMLRRALTETGGRFLEFPVRVDWPELRLTEEQIMANAAARAFGQPIPFPDPSLFTIKLPVGVR